MTTRWRVLTIGSETNRQVVETAMVNWSVELHSCATLKEAQAALASARHPVVLVDDKLPDGSYHDVLKLLGSRLDQTRVVILAAGDLDECCREAQAIGAFDVITSPCRRTDVQWIIIRAVQDQQHRKACQSRSRHAESTLADTNVGS